MTPLAIFPQGNQSRPNLVFIMTDQFRGDALGCMQKEPVQTPNLDKLAEERSYQQLSGIISGPRHAHDRYVPHYKRCNRQL